MRLAIFALLAVSCGCSPSSSPKADPLVGTYVKWIFLEGKAVPLDGSSGTRQTLTLEPGGKFTWHSESSVMMTLSANAEGTYTRAIDEVTLSGTLKSKMDDGYKKSTDTVPFKLRLKVNGDVLVDPAVGSEGAFRKVGEGPPPLPASLRLKEPSTPALQLFKRTEQTYASLKYLEVSGTVASEGRGFAPKKASFLLLFERPSKLRFEESVSEGSLGDRGRNEITWDGGEKCWWYSSQFGVVTDRTLGNALSLLAGPEDEFLSSLLLPEMLGDGGVLSRYPEATLLGDEKLGGRNCSVLQLRNKDANIVKLWVEQSTGLILREWDELLGATVTFDPKPDAKIDPGRFMLGRRAK